MLDLKFEMATESVKYYCSWTLQIQKIGYVEIKLAMKELVGISHFLK